jgi:hypothetical protein
MGYDDKGIWVSRRVQRHICAWRSETGGGGRAKRRPPPPGTGNPQGAEPSDPKRDVGSISILAKDSWSAAAASASWRSAVTRWCDTRTRHRASRPSPITSATRATSMAATDIWPHRVMVFMKGVAGRPEVDLRDHLLDRARHCAERNLRKHRLQFSLKFNLYAGLQTETLERARFRVRIRSGSATIA